MKNDFRLYYFCFAYNGVDLISGYKSGHEELTVSRSEVNNHMRFLCQVFKVSVAFLGCYLNS